MRCGPQGISGGSQGTTAAQYEVRTPAAAAGTASPMLTDDFEVIDPRFSGLVFGNVHLEKLYSGCRWAEGPAWFAAGRYLVWSDIPNDRILRWDETDGSVSVFRQPAMNTNGNTVDREGRLVSCEHRGRCISRTGFEGRREVLADRYKASASTRRTTSSSRATAASGSPTRATASTRTTKAMRLQARSARATSTGSTPTTGASTLVADDFVQPNGLAFSPDESLLYIVDTGLTHQADGPHHVRASAWPTTAGRWAAARCSPPATPGCIDGLRVDARGNLWLVGRRRRALPRPRRRAARQDPRARDGGQPHLRRAEAEPPLHLRHHLAVRGVPQHPRGSARPMSHAATEDHR